jgi:hypothetical protein
VSEAEAVRRERLPLLLGLLAMAALVLAGRYFVPRLLGEPEARGAAAQRVTRVALPTVEQLRLSLLDAKPAAHRPGRDPFQFAAPPPPPPPTQEELAAAARRRAEEETLRQQLEAQRQVELSIPRPPEFSMKYLGNFGPPSRRIAVFSDGRNIYNALKGDTIDGRFVLAEIGLESVEIRFVGFPDAPARRVGISG